MSSGVHCETNRNECISQPCQNNAKCIDQVNGYTCDCTGTGNIIIGLKLKKSYV